MKNTIKRTLSLFITMAMLCAFVPIMPASAATIDIGDYVQMGTYYGEPILWRCVDIDENGPLMLSDKIICLKPFDAEASSNTTTGSHGRSSGRQSYESNYWGDSNMRSWLNSSASAGNVNWLCGNPPIDSEVYYNAYDQEAGFLTNFTQSELNAVKSVTQKSLLSWPEYDAGMATTGSEQHDYEYGYPDEAVTNYDTAYAEYVTDKMFLLDVKQVNEVYNNSDILGEDYYIGEPTAQCVANSEYKDEGYLESGKKWHYWLRSPDSYDSYGVRCVYSDGYVSYGYSAYTGRLGVRPAFYLNLPSFSITSGSGSESNPYVGYGAASGGTTIPVPIVTPMPTISSDENYTGGSELIKQAGLDAKNLLSNISVGTDTIKGPKLSILGHDIYLFQIDGKFSLKFGKVPVKFSVDNEKNTIQIMLGYEFMDEDVNTGTDYSGRGEWTKAYNDLKSLYTSLAGGKLNDKTAKSKFSSVYKKLKKTDSNLFMNITGSFAFYGELAFSNGEWKMTEGGGILKASAEGSIDPRIGGIFYGTFGVSVDAEGKLAVTYDYDVAELAVNVGLTIEPAINIGIGAGSKKANFYAEGGLKGKLPIEVMAATGSFKTGQTNITPLRVRAQGFLYVSAKAFLLGYEDDWQLGDDIVLWPRSGDLTLQSLENYYEIREEDLKLLPRDYKNKLTLMSVSDMFEKTNLYPYSTPRLVQLDDDAMMLLWIDDDSAKADADRTSMYYSIYNPSENMWSQPQIAVSNDGYNDLPQTCADGEKVHIVWTYIDEVLGDTAQLDDMQTKIDLYYTSFDGESFSQPKLISDNGNDLCEVLYDVTVLDGEVTVAWAENSENDLSLSDGTNRIYKRTLVNGEWSSTETVAEIEGELHDIQLHESGKVIYEIKENDVTELYADNVKFAQTENDNSAFQVLDDVVYYLSGTALNTYNIKRGIADAQEIGEITDITILKDGNKKLALTLLSTGFTNELYQNECIDGEWGSWTQLTEYNKYIRDYSATIRNGELNIALNLINVDDEEKGGYSDATLKVIEDAEYNDIILNDTVYYDGEVREGGQIDICFDVTNNSRNDVKSVNVTVYDRNDEIMYSGDVACDIAAGQTQALSVPVDLPTYFTRQSFEVEISSEFEENNVENNSATVSIGFADIALEQLSVNKNGDVYTLTGVVHNLGYEDARDVKLEIYNSDATDELLHTMTFAAVMEEQRFQFEYELPEQYISSEEAKKAIYIEIETESEEVEFGNNSDRIVMADLTEIDTIDNVTMSYDNNVLMIKSPKAMGVNFIAAYYDENGALMACHYDTLAVGIGTNEILVEGLTTGANVKFMLWNENMQPLCEYLTWK